MYLSRVELDITNRNTLKAFNNRNYFHTAISYCFQGEKVLWRLDSLNNKYYLMLVSHNKVSLEHLQKQFGTPKTTFETKDYSSFIEQISHGQEWQFRLAANPVKSCKTNKSSQERGKTLAHTTIYHQQEWLKSRAAKNGFYVSDDSFKVIGSEWFIFKKRESKNRITLLSVIFEGKLTITDPVLFKQSLEKGIGKGKAYGLGMITIAQLKSQ